MFIAVQRQISPKHQQDDRWRRDQGRPRRGCQQTLLVRRKEDEKHYLELDGLDDVTEDAFKAESGKTNVSLCADDTANSISLTHSPSQSWSKETKTSGVGESVSKSTNDQDSAKMREMWITTVDPDRDHSRNKFS